MSLVIDSDGHFIEPVELWDNYLEPKYRDRSIRYVRDERGHENYMVIAGKRSRLDLPNILNLLTACGQLERVADPTFSAYRDGPPAAFDSHARVKYISEEGIDKVLLYPTLGLLWEVELGNDAELAAAYCRAYNNWLLDMCKPYPDRLIPIGHLSLIDVEEGVKELKRVAKLGMKGVFVSAYAYNGKPYGHPYYEPFWAEAQELGLPVGIHPVGVANFVGHQYYQEPSLWYFVTMISEEVKVCFTTLFNDGLFDRFPRLKIVLVEANCGWVATWLERMDHKSKYTGHTISLKGKPSEYFQRQCWMSVDPDECAIPAMVRLVGEDKFFWASDYPHAEGYLHPVAELKEVITELPESAQRKILGENAAKLYNLS